MNATKQETLNRIKQMQGLRDRGLSYGQIAGLFGLSRQRVQQLLSGYHKLNNVNWYTDLCSFILLRDDNKCSKCDETANLLVHHLDDNNSNNKLSNLVTLCSKCHLALHRPPNNAMKGKMYKTERNQLLLDYYKSHPGITLQETGKVFGVTKQRVFQIIKHYA